jgi:hypothetical protein
MELFLSAIGEMDIIAVFETVGGGSIPSWPAKYLPIVQGIEQ